MQFIPFLIFFSTIEWPHHFSWTNATKSIIKEKIIRIRRWWKGFLLSWKFIIKNLPDIVLFCFCLVFSFIFVELTIICLNPCPTSCPSQHTFYRMCLIPDQTHLTHCHLSWHFYALSNPLCTDIQPRQTFERIYSLSIKTVEEEMQRCQGICNKCQKPGSGSGWRGGGTRVSSFLTWKGVI